MSYYTIRNWRNLFEGQKEITLLNYTQVETATHLTAKSGHYLKSFDSFYLTRITSKEPVT